MSDLECINCGESWSEQAMDVGAVLAALRSAGADRFDRAGFHFLDVLAGRASEQSDDVRRIIDVRLATALGTFHERFERARCDATASIAGVIGQHPQVAGELQQLFDAADFAGIERRIAALQPVTGTTSSLAELTRYIDSHSPEGREGCLDQSSRPRGELKALRHDRDIWSKLSAEKQMRNAVAHAPENAGPLNSHMLVLRSLSLMSELSPDYLSRFMSYVDTLLMLDQLDVSSKPALKVRSRTKAIKR